MSVQCASLWWRWCSCKSPARLCLLLGRTWSWQTGQLEAFSTFKMSSHCLYQGIARTQSPTNTNYAPESPTFGVIAEVNPAGVQWPGLALKNPPTGSWISLCQVSMLDNVTHGTWIKTLLSRDSVWYRWHLYCGPNNSVFARGTEITLLNISFVYGHIACKLFWFPKTKQRGWFWSEIM